MPPLFYYIVPFCFPLSSIIFQYNVVMYTYLQIRDKQAAHVQKKKKKKVWGNNTRLLLPLFFFFFFF
ncbi:hypothetical protein QBC45DRAFT_401031, partial [Copromyces sp. CBS 386.78]